MRRLQALLLNAFLLLIPLLAGAWLLTVQPAHAQYPGSGGGSNTGINNGNTGFNDSGSNDSGSNSGFNTDGLTDAPGLGPGGGNNTGSNTSGTGTGGNNTGYPGGGTGGGNIGTGTGTTGTGGNNTGSSTGSTGGTGGTGTSGNNSGNTGGTGGSNSGYPGGTGGSNTGYPGGNTGGSETGTGGTITPGHWDVSYSSQGTSSWDYQTDDSAVQSGTLPWSTTDSGASVGSSSYLDAATIGTISATLTWVPTTGQDPTSDPPASSVLVTETGYAAASGGGVGAASADDGWGDTSGGGEYPADSSGGGGYPGDSSSASSSGTHYEVKDGSSGTITVGPFTLSASTPDNTTPDADGNFSTVGAFASVGLAVAGASNTISLTGANTANQALTGQQVTAHFNGAPPNVSSYTWSFPSGTPIKTWDPNGKAADGITLQQLFPLTDADKTGTDTTGRGIAVAALGFYDQTAEKVTVKCVVNYTLPKDKQGNAKSGTMTVTSNPVTFLKPTATLELNSADPTTGFFNNAGAQEFGANEFWYPISISLPTPFIGTGGLGCLAQTTTSSRTLKRNSLNGQDTYSLKIPSTQSDGSIKWIIPGEGLDTAFPYPKGYKLDAQGVPQPVTTNYTWNVTDEGISGDKPAQSYIANDIDNGGNDWYDSSAKDTFSTWVMYQPNGGIWVPLLKLDWGWNGEASKSNGSWLVNGTAPPPTKTVATTPPKWSVVITGQQYRP